MNNNLTLSVTLTGDGRQLSGTLKNAQGEVQAFGGSTVREGDRAERSLANVERRAGTVGRELQVLTRLAAPLGAAFAGMFAGRAIQSQIDYADRLQKTNLRIGASVEALSQYNHVAGLSGVAFEQLTTGWQRQTRRISEAAQGYGTAKDALDALGLSAEELNQLAPEDQFERIAEALQGVESQADRTALAMKLWDTEGVGLLQIVNQGTDAMRAMREEADRLGLTISQETADAMATYNDEMARFQAVATGVTRQVASELVPAMTSGLQTTSEWINEMGGAATILDTVKDAATGVAVVMAGRYVGALTTATAAKLAATRQAVLYQAALARMSGVSATTAAGQMALAGSVRAASGAMALVGGPAGVALIAVGALYTYRKELGLVDDTAKNTERALEECAQAINSGSVAALDANYDTLVNSLEAVSLQAQEAMAQLTELTARQKFYENSHQGISASITEAIGEQEQALASLWADQVRIQTAQRKNREEAEALQNSTRQTTQEFKTLDQWLLRTTETTGESTAANTANADSQREQAAASAAFSKQLEQLQNRLIPYRRETVQLAQDQNTLNLAFAMGRIDAGEYLQMMGALQQGYLDLGRETEAAATTVGDEADRMATLFNRQLERMDDASVDMWRSFLDGSEDAFGSFRRLALDTLAEVIHNYTTRQITASLGFNMAGGGGMPGGASGGGFGIGPGSIGNAWSAVKGGIGGIQWGGAGGAQAYGGGWANAATSGTGATGYLGGSMQNFQGMQGLAGAGAGFAGGYAGTQVGQSLFGKEAGSSYGATGGALVGTYFGGPLGAAIGGAIGGAIDAAFGRSKKTYDFDFVQGQQPGIFGDRDSALGGFGIAKFSDFKLGEEQDQLQQLMDQIAVFDNTLANAAIDERLDAMRQSVEGFTYSGPEGLFDARLREIIDGSGAYVEQAIAAISDPEQMANAFVAVLNLERITQSLNAQIQSDVVDHLEANTNDIQGTAASLSQAIDATVLLGNSAERLNLQFDTTTDGAIHYAWSLQEAAGGLDNLSNLQSSYYQNYFTAAEREANLRDDLTQSMQALGFELPKTRQGFRELAEAQDLNTTAGAHNYAALLQLESAFAQLVPAIESTSNSANTAASVLREKEQLERQLLQIQGNTAEIRRRDLLEVSESNRPLQQRVWALQDEQERLRELESKQQDRVRTINQERDALAKARQQLAGFSNSINDWLANLRGTDAGLASPGDQLAATSQAFYEQYAKAENGDRDALNSITQYADRFIEAQKNWGASSPQTKATIDKVAALLERLPAQLSAEQFLADEFRGALSDQTAALGVMLDLNGIVSALATEFDGIDVNASGLIDYDEFHAAFSGIASESTLDKLFWLMDKNGDGQISRLESIAASSMTIAELGLQRQAGDTDDIMGGNPSVIDDIVKKYPVTDPTAQKINAAYHDVLGKSAQGFQVTSWSRWLSEKETRNGQLHQAVAWANLPVGGEDWLKARGLYGDGTVPEFADGGYTGPGGKYDEAGIVHAGEIVWSQDDIARAGGVDTVEALRKGLEGPARMQLRMNELPPLPNFPLLNNSDIVEAVRNLKREVTQLRKENAQLQREGNKHAAASVRVSAEGHKRQIEATERGNRSLNDMAASSRLERAR